MIESRESFALLFVWGDGNTSNVGVRTDHQVYCRVGRRRDPSRELIVPIAIEPNHERVPCRPSRRNLRFKELSRRHHQTKQRAWILEPIQFVVLRVVDGDADSRSFDLCRKLFAGKIETRSCLLQIERANELLALSLSENPS